MMNAGEMFGLAIRILGVVLLCYGVQDLVDSVMFKLGFSNFVESTPTYYFVRGLLSFGAGIYFVRGAPLLVSTAYPPEDEDEEATKISRSARDKNEP